MIFIAHACLSWFTRQDNNASDEHVGMAEKLRPFAIRLNKIMFEVKFRYAKAELTLSIRLSCLCRELTS